MFFVCLSFGWLPPDNFPRLDLVTQSMWLLFYCLGTNYHELPGFKQHTFITSQTLRVRNLAGLSWIFFSASHQAAFEVSAKTAISSGAQGSFQAQCCWQNSASGGWRSVPQLRETTCHSLPRGQLHSMTVCFHKSIQQSSICWHFLSCTSRLFLKTLTWLGQAHWR